MENGYHVVGSCNSYHFGGSCDDITNRNGVNSVGFVGAVDSDVVGIINGVAHDVFGVVGNEDDKENMLDLTPPIENVDVDMLDLTPPIENADIMLDLTTPIENVDTLDLTPPIQDVGTPNTSLNSDGSPSETSVSGSENDS